MRISDWSSDVALPILQAAHEKRAGFVRRQREDRVGGLERFTKMAGLQPELRHRLQRLDIGRIERYGVAIRIIGPRNRVRRPFDPAPQYVILRLVVARSDRFPDCTSSLADPALFEKCLRPRCLGTGGRGRTSAPAKPDPP